MIEAPDPNTMRREALARWDNEGGAGPKGPQMQKSPRDIIDSMSAPRDGALMQRHIRVIAIENLKIALLANATDAQKALACSLAAHIAPRPGSTHHSLTAQAARRMLDMAGRTEHLAASEPVTQMASRQHCED